VQGFWGFGEQYVTEGASAKTVTYCSAAGHTSTNSASEDKGNSSNWRQVTIKFISSRHDMAARQWLVVYNDRIASAAEYFPSAASGDSARWHHTTIEQCIANTSRSTEPGTV